MHGKQPIENEVLHGRVCLYFPLVTFWLSFTYFFLTRKRSICSADDVKRKGIIQFIVLIKKKEGGKKMPISI